jgi:3-deoxy-D-manno-octulosonate 8-phosphate phosphatase (KDO 8-P phosphatase)
MKRAGVAVAVANGTAEVKAEADYITRATGGHGAVRETVELLLKAQAKWDAVVAAHTT